MPVSHAVSALTKKHSEIQGEILAMEKRLELLSEQLKALEISITVFEPDFKLSEIKAKRKNHKHLDIGKGEVSAIIGEYIRLADKEFTANDLITYIFEQKPELPESALPSVRQSVSKSLRRFANRRMIQSVGRGISQGSPLIWQAVY